MKSPRHFLRLVSYILLQTFIVQDFALAAELVPSKKDLFSKPAVSLAIPASIATVEDAYFRHSERSEESLRRKDPSSPAAPQDDVLVYLIQDAHTNASGQLNLAKTLDLLMSKDKDLKYVFLEAAVGDNTLAFLRPYTQPEERRKLALSYIREGLLHGEEYLDLTSGHQMVLWGVENLELYKQTLESYRSVAQERERFDLYLKKIDSTLTTLKERSLNPGLLQFDKDLRKFVKEEISLTDYFNVLLRETTLLNISLKDYPHLKNLQALKDQESKIDFKIANDQQLKAIQSLSEADQKELTEVTQSAEGGSASGGKNSPFKLGSSDSKEGRAFYALLEEKLANRHPEARSAEGSLRRIDSSLATLVQNDVYPELIKYFDYIKLANEVEAKGVLDELKALENRILDRYTKTEDEKWLVQSSKMARLYEKLFHLTMTPEEFEEYMTLTGRHSERSEESLRRIDPSSPAAPQDDVFGIEHLTGFLNKKIMDLGTYYERSLFLEKGYSEMVRNAESFYSLTFERDKHFIDQMLSKLDESSSISHLPSSIQKSAVLITGGFHTTNLKAMLKQKGISFVSLMPQVLHETNMKRYESILLGQNVAGKAPAMSGLAAKAGKARTLGTMTALPYASTEELQRLATDFKIPLEEMIRVYSKNIGSTGGLPIGGMKAILGDPDKTPSGEVLSPSTSFGVVSLSNHKPARSDGASKGSRMSENQSAIIAKQALDRIQRIRDLLRDFSILEMDKRSDPDLTFRYSKSYPSDFLSWAGDKLSVWDFKILAGLKSMANKRIKASEVYADFHGFTVLFLGDHVFLSIDMFLSGAPVIGWDPKTGKLEATILDAKTVEQALIVPDVELYELAQEDPSVGSRLTVEQAVALVEKIGIAKLADAGKKVGINVTSDEESALDFAARIFKAQPDSPEKMVFWGDLYGYFTKADLSDIDAHTEGDFGRMKPSGARLSPEDERRVRDVVASSLGLESSTDEFKSWTLLRDTLGADSLDMPELRFELEKEFGVEFPEELNELDWHTIGDLYIDVTAALEVTGKLSSGSRLDEREAGPPLLTVKHSQTKEVGLTFGEGLQLLTVKIALGDAALIKFYQRPDNESYMRLRNNNGTIEIGLGVYGQYDGFKDWQERQGGGFFVAYPDGTLGFVVEGRLPRERFDFITTERLLADSEAQTLLPFVSSTPPSPGSSARQAEEQAVKTINEVINKLDRAESKDLIEILEKTTQTVRKIERSLEASQLLDSAKNDLLNSAWLLQVLGRSDLANQLDSAFESVSAFGRALHQETAGTAPAGSRLVDDADVARLESVISRITSVLDKLDAKDKVRYNLVSASELIKDPSSRKAGVTTLELSATMLRNSGNVPLANEVTEIVKLIQDTEVVTPAPTPATTPPAGARLTPADIEQAVLNALAAPRSDKEAYTNLLPIAEADPAALQALKTRYRAPDIVKQDPNKADAVVGLVDEVLEVAIGQMPSLGSRLTRLMTQLTLAAQLAVQGQAPQLARQEQETVELEAFMNSPRFEHTTRTWTARDIQNLGAAPRTDGYSDQQGRGFYSFLRGLFENRKKGEGEYYYVTGGAQDGNQAAVMALNNAKAFYGSGWLFSFRLGWPDLAKYVYSWVPDNVKEIINVLMMQKSKETHRMNQLLNQLNDIQKKAVALEAKKKNVTEEEINKLRDELTALMKEITSLTPGVNFDLYSLVDGDTGHNAVSQLVELFIQAGAAAVHLEDQLEGKKKCGHMDGKVIVPIQEMILRLLEARASADFFRSAIMFIARTDSEAGKLLSANSDRRDHPFIVGSKTRDIPALKELINLAWNKDAAFKGVRDKKLQTLSKGPWAKFVPYLRRALELQDQGRNDLADAELIRLTTEWANTADLKTYYEAVADEIVSQAVGQGVLKRASLNEARVAWEAMDKKTRGNQHQEMYTQLLTDKGFSQHELGKKLSRWIRTMDPVDPEPVDAVTGKKLKNEEFLHHEDAVAYARALGFDVYWNMDTPRTFEGFFQVRPGVDYAIVRSRAYAPYADGVWMEQEKPIKAQAIKWINSVRNIRPWILGFLNLSPNFNWDDPDLWKGMTLEQINEELKNFASDLGKGGIDFMFFTLYGMHASLEGVHEVSRNVYGKKQKDKDSELLRGQEVFDYVNGVQRRERAEKAPFLKGNSFVPSNWVADRIQLYLRAGAADVKSTGAHDTMAQFDKSVAGAHQGIKDLTKSGARLGNLDIREGLDTRYEDVYTPQALEVLQKLAPLTVEQTALMEKRYQRRADRFANKKDIGFLDPESIIPGTNIKVQDARDGKFEGAPVPADLQRQWIQGTGPAARPRETVERSLRNVAYALLSGADGWMFDGEDALGQVDTMSLDNIRNLKLAIHKDPLFLRVAEDVAKELIRDGHRPADFDWKKQLDFTTKLYRTRGLHLNDRHMKYVGKDGKEYALSATVADMTLYIVNNYERLLDEGSTPTFYLPKLQTAEEAAFMARIMDALEDSLTYKGKPLARGTIKAFVLVEQLEESFQLMEMRAALGKHFVGFNTGRWDYINSVSDAKAWDMNFIQPNIESITMVYGYMANYEDRVRRASYTPDLNGNTVHWIGGMEPNIPVGLPEGVKAAMERAVAGKEREFKAGAGGAWVAHWKMVPIVRPVWEKGFAGTGKVNYLDIKVTPLTYTQKDADGLTELAEAPRTIRGAKNLLSVGMQYGNAFARGFAAAALKAADFFGDDAILYLMEDAATGEIRLSILHEWVHKGAVITEDDPEYGVMAGDIFKPDLFKRLLADEYDKLLRAKNKDVHDDSKTTTLPIARQIVESYVLDPVKFPWYIDILNIVLNVHDLEEATRRINHYTDTWKKTGRRVTENLDFPVAASRLAGPLTALRDPKNSDDARRGIADTLRKDLQGDPALKLTYDERENLLIALNAKRNSDDTRRKIAEAVHQSLQNDADPNLGRFQLNSLLSALNNPGNSDTTRWVIANSIRQALVTSPGLKPTDFQLNRLLSALNIKENTDDTRWVIASAIHQVLQKSPDLDITAGSRLGARLVQGLDSIPNDFVRSQVRWAAEFLGAGSVKVLDSSDKDSLIRLALENAKRAEAEGKDPTRNGLVKLADNNLFARSHFKDVARSEERTFIATGDPMDKGVANNWRLESDLVPQAEARMKGKLNGGEVYVLPWIMGHPGSPYREMGVQVTTSLVTAIQLMTMASVGFDSYPNSWSDFDNWKANTESEFIVGVHYPGDLDKTRRTGDVEIVQADSIRKRYDSPEDQYIVKDSSGKVVLIYTVEGSDPARAFTKADDIARLLTSPKVAALPAVFLEVGQNTHVATSEEDDRFFISLPAKGLILSTGSDYGGNANLTKKFVLRQGVYNARKGKTLYEHMMLAQLTEIATGRKLRKAGAYPSASGKTTNALNPGTQAMRKVYEFEAFNDDLIKMWITPSGVYGMGMEKGIFGVVPGSNEEHDPGFMKAIGPDTGTIFTNIAVNLKTGETWWEGRTKDYPSLERDGQYWTDWKGQRIIDRKPENRFNKKTPWAHPNSRATTSLSNISNLAPEFNDPQGVKIDAIYWGGKVLTFNQPAIMELRNLDEGIYDAAAMRVVASAAADGKAGEVRRDMGAMKPFMADSELAYISRMYDFFKQAGPNAPRFFHINQFAGEWPGYDFNDRLDDWVFRRIHENAGYQERAMGNVPRVQDLNLDDVNLNPEQLDRVFSYDPQLVFEKVQEDAAFFKELSEKTSRPIPTFLTEVNEKWLKDLKAELMAKNPSAVEGDALAGARFAGDPLTEIINVIGAYPLATRHLAYRDSKLRKLASENRVELQALLARLDMNEYGELAGAVSRGEVTDTIHTLLQSTMTPEEAGYSLSDAPGGARLSTIDEATQARLHAVALKVIKPADGILTEEALRAYLRDVSLSMVPTDGGVMAADESAPSMLKWLQPFGLSNEGAEGKANRQAARTIIARAAQGLNDNGVRSIILDKDTFDNVDVEADKLLVDMLKEAGILIGLKTDSGLADDMASPLVDNPDPKKRAEGQIRVEKFPKPDSIPNLTPLLEKHADTGIVFTKWRVVVAIDFKNGLPREENVRENMRILAKQAKLTQLAGLVPIVEPEILFDGEHDITSSKKASELAIRILFEELANEGVWLDGIVLKTSMVLAGKFATQSASKEVGFETLVTLLKTVPSEVPSIVFLSGGQKDDQVNNNLNAVSLARIERFNEARDKAASELETEGRASETAKVRSYTQVPWEISYSFGRGLVGPGYRVTINDTTKIQQAIDELHKAAGITQQARQGTLQGVRLLSKAEIVNILARFLQVDPQKNHVVYVGMQNFKDEASMRAHVESLPDAAQFRINQVGAHMKAEPQFPDDVSGARLAVEVTKVEKKRLNSLPKDLARFDIYLLVSGAQQPAVISVDHDEKKSIEFVRSQAVEIVKRYLAQHPFATDISAGAGSAVYNQLHQREKEVSEFTFGEPTPRAEDETVLARRVLTEFERIRRSVAQFAAKPTGSPGIAAEFLTWAGDAVTADGFKVFAELKDYASAPLVISQLRNARAGDLFALLFLDDRVYMTIGFQGDKVPAIVWDPATDTLAGVTLDSASVEGATVYSRADIFRLAELNGKGARLSLEQQNEISGLMEKVAAILDETNADDKVKKKFTDIRLMVLMAEQDHHFDIARRQLVEFTTLVDRSSFAAVHDFLSQVATVLDRAQFQAPVSSDSFESDALAGARLSTVRPLDTYTKATSKVSSNFVVEVAPGETPTVGELLDSIVLGENVFRKMHHMDPISKDRIGGIMIENSPNRTLENIFKAAVRDGELITISWAGTASSFIKQQEEQFRGTSEGPGIQHGTRLGRVELIQDGEDGPLLIRLDENVYLKPEEIASMNLNIWVQQHALSGQKDVRFTPVGDRTLVNDVVQVVDAKNVPLRKFNLRTPEGVEALVTYLNQLGGYTAVLTPRGRSLTSAPTGARIVSELEELEQWSLVHLLRYIDQVDDVTKVEEHSFRLEGTTQWVLVRFEGDSVNPKWARMIVERHKGAQDNAEPFKTTIYFAGSFLRGELRDLHAELMEVTGSRLVLEKDLADSPALTTASMQGHLEQIALINERLLSDKQTLAIFDLRTLVLLDLQVHKGRGKDKGDYLIVDQNGQTVLKVDLKTLSKSDRKGAKTALNALSDAITQMKSQNLRMKGLLSDVALDSQAKALLSIDIGQFNLSGNPLGFDIFVGQIIQFSKTAEGKGSLAMFKGDPALVRLAQERLTVLHNDFGLDTRLFISEQEAPAKEGYKTVNLFSPENIRPTDNAYNLAMDEVSNDQALNFTPHLMLAVAVARSSSDPSKNEALRHAFQELVGHEVAPGVWSDILYGRASLETLKNNVLKPLLDAFFKDMVQFHRAAMTVARSA